MRGAYVDQCAPGQAAPAAPNAPAANGCSTGDCGGCGNGPVGHDSPGPAFFRCERVGLGGRSFRMLKFRKMWDGATGAGLTAPNDARLTRLGIFLAASKLDELPQLWNVVRGDMNLVGPRPEAPEFVRAQAEAYARIVTVRSNVNATLMALGIEASSCGRIALMRSTVSMMLAPGCL